MSRSPLFRRPSPAMIVASIALVTGGAGTATAASLITGKQIKNSTITAADIKANSIPGSDIRNGSLAGVDLKNSTVTAAKLAPSAKAALKGDTGPAGPAGAQGAAGAPGAPGAAGPAGPQGPAGPSDGYETAVGTPGAAPNSKAAIDTLDLPRGSFIITAKVDATFGGPAEVLECDLVNDGTVLGRSRIVSSGVGRQVLTVLAAPTLTGFVVNATDVTFECADSDTGVSLNNASAVAVKVASMTGA